MSNSFTNSKLPFLLTFAYNANSVYAGPLWTKDPPELLHTPPTIDAPIDVEPITECGSFSKV